MTERYNLEQVFVPVGIPEKTFVKREDLEVNFKSWQMTPGKHLLMFGPSKCSKTTLWRKLIEQKGEFIKISCDTEQDLKSIYATILDNLNASYKSETQTSTSVKSTFWAELQALVIAIFKLFIRGQIE